MIAYLFDLDGTLIDSFEDIALSVNFARRAVGLDELPLRDIYPFIGEGAQRLIERALGQENAEKLDQALSLWREHYSSHMLDNTAVYKGIKEVLQSLSGPLAVITNKPGAHARLLVDSLHLNKFFSFVLGGGDVPFKKPDPSVIDEALRNLPGVEQAVLIGDSIIDARTAKAAKIAFVGVLWGQGRKEEFLKEGAEMLVDYPNQIPQACALALKSINSKDS